MEAAIRNVSAWLSRSRGPARAEVLLIQRRIFILPTAFGVLFAVVLLLMLTGAINYGLSLGFILTFLLASMAVTAILHTFRNLLGLRVNAGRTAPVFAGDTAQFSICITNPTPAARYAIAVARAGLDVAIVDVAAESEATATVAAPAPRRGWLRPGRLTLHTRFPVGLFRAWSYVELDTRCLVFPRPAAPGLPLPPLDRGSGEGANLAPGAEDFVGLRRYTPGDSPRHVAWKATARDDALLTKHFVGRASSALRLSLELLPRDLDLEEKLSQLTRWVLDAHGRGVPIALELPDRRIEAGYGESHRDACLEALALHDPAAQR